MAALGNMRSDDYTVGWICALTIEYAAARAMLDEEHEDLPTKDTNVYTLGRIGGHDVVIACLPFGEIGSSAAALLATKMLSTFTRIRFGLSVGIGGGVPSENIDIRLADITVGTPGIQSGSVVQYDFRRAVQSSRFIDQDKGFSWFFQ